MENPYVPPSSSFSPVASDASSPVKTYAGIGRLAYVVLLFALGFLHTVGVSFVQVMEPDARSAAPMALFVVLGVGVLHVLLAVQRLINVGVSGWWALLLFIPIVNLFIFVRCVIAPEGYADHKRLDVPGIIMLVLLGLLFVLFLLALVA